MAIDWLADVRKYAATADEAVVGGITRYCGIALASRDGQLVAFSDKAELATVRENFLKKKLGLTASDAELDAMIAADAVLVASGTATLEAALLKRPMVITYKMGKWSFRLMRRMAYLPWVGLPNVLAGREVVPEILQDAATPQALADALDAWLTDKDKVAELTRVFTDMHQQLRQDTAAKAAAAILPYLQGRGR